MKLMIYNTYFFKLLHGEVTSDFLGFIPRSLILIYIKDTRDDFLLRLKLVTKHVFMSLREKEEK